MIGSDPIGWSSIAVSGEELVIYPRVSANMKSGGANFTTSRADLGADLLWDDGSFIVWDDDTNIGWEA